MKAGIRVRTWRGVMLAIALGFTAALAVALLLTSGARATQPSGLKYVPGWLYGLSSAKLIHAAPAGRELTIGVGVQRPNPAAEIALYNELYDPASREYHHFLTPAQFNARFGVPAATESAVRSWLTSTGAQVVQTYDEGSYLQATGTVAQFDRLFHVQIGDYTAAHKAFFANNRPPQVPATLPVSGVLGLDSVHKMSLASLTTKRLTRGMLAAARRSAVRPAAVPPATNYQVAFTPQDLWKIYNMPGAAALTDSKGRSDPASVANSPDALGQGQTIGVFGEGEIASMIPSLRQFEQTMGLPKVPVRVVLTEGHKDSDYGDNTGEQEWNLDTQASTGMAPDVQQLDYYFAKAFFDSDVEADFATWAADPNGPREMNASFGECEANPTNPATGNPNIQQSPYGTGLGDNVEAVAEATLRQATMEGRTLFTSAGDTGSGCPEVVAGALGAANGLAVQPVPDVGYPCASQYAVCVGGTVITTTGPSYPDTTKVATDESWTYTGGGSSFYIPAPSFQSKVTAVNLDCIGQPNGMPYSSVTQCRGVPDVAALSGDEAGDGYTIYVDGLSLGGGGTSLSSPLTVGEWARIQSAAPASVQSSGGVGFADPLIYKQASDADTCGSGAGASVTGNVTNAMPPAPCTGAPSYARDFTDITQSEDVGDEAGTGGLLGIFGQQPPSTMVSGGNGFYQPTPGWDYTSGWGSLNVANFMQDVDGTTKATGSYTGPEADALQVCTFQATSPPGNATDLTTFKNDPGADLSAATISSPDAGHITATWTVPSLSAGIPNGATGMNFYAIWVYNGHNYYAAAEDSQSGWAYASGEVTNGIVRTDSSPTAAKGTEDPAKGLITVTVPTSEVGKPPVGALLLDPLTYSLVEGAVANVFVVPGTDSADELGQLSVDRGLVDSTGVSVVVGGAPGTNCVPSVRGGQPNNNLIGSSKTRGFTTARHGVLVACTKASALPITHIIRKSISARRLLLTGISEAHCPKYIARVGIAIARVKNHKCSFLSAKHRWGKYGSCRPRSYLRAIGGNSWAFFLKLKLAPGIYHLWEHAVDNKGVATRNRATKFVWFKIRRRGTAYVP
jgi:subtilase family serine protease